MSKSAVNRIEHSDHVKAAANGRWREILSRHDINVPPRASQHGPCPHCGGKDRFRFDDQRGDGSYICGQCGAGDGFSLLMKCFGWTFKEVLDAVTRDLGIESRDIQSPITCQRSPSEKTKFNERKQQRIEELWQSTQRINWPVAKYFQNRSLSALSGRVPSCLRAVDALDYWEFDGNDNLVSIGRFPALISAVTDLAGNLVSVHRTYLTEYGHKASVPSPRKLMSPALSGSLCGCAIKLCEPTDELCLAEGLETALAVLLSTGRPTWACITAGLLERVEIPEHAQRVNIMADRDRSGRGEEAAEALAAKLVGRYSVKIVLPPAPIPPNKKSIDWLDIYQQEVSA